MPVKATQLRPGNVILKDGDLFRVESASHVTPGNWRGMVQTRLRNLKNGSSYEHRFRSEDLVEKAVMEQHPMEYLYAEGDHHVFMNSENYEQVHIPAAVLAGALSYLLPNMTAVVEFHEGTPMGIELPLSVRLKVVDTEPGMRGATASGSPKPARLETGLMVNVPQFVAPGDTIEVDTRTGAYITRV
jgi:elongation factor P